MEIRKKISYQFTAISAGILLLTVVIIYLLFSTYRKDDFRQRLGNKAKSIGQLIAETDSIDARLLQRMEQNNPSSLVAEKIAVFDTSYNLLYASGKDPACSMPDENFFSLQNSEMVFDRNGNQELVYFHFAGSRREILVCCSAEDIFGMQKLRQLRLILSIVFLFSLVVIFIFGRLFAAKALEPISELVTQVDQIDISRINAKINAGSGKDEISKLAETFNRMLARLDTAIKYQKGFISNASHELRTPLTAITVQLDVALMQERKNEEYRKIIHSVLQDIKNLNDLTNKLLTLTHLEDDQQVQHFKEVRIDEVLWNARSDILLSHPRYEINIFFSEQIEGEHHLHCLGNAMLLKTAFLNIIENGCKYSADHQTSIHLSVHDQYCTIHFKDNGIGIPRKDISHIFQPFYRAENAKDKQGHGVGLSLTERIISLHQGKLKVHSVLNSGTEVSISLPLL